MAESLDDMDAYVDWGYLNTILDGAGTLNGAQIMPNDNACSAVENASGDDGFAALRDYVLQDRWPALGNNQLETPLQNGSSLQLLWEAPEHPCDHCVLGSYYCKKIREGLHKGYCTSCVALGLTCSFGPMFSGRGNFELAQLGDDDSGISDRAHAMPVEDFPSDVMQGHQAIITDHVGVTANDEEKSPLPKIGARFSRDSVRVLKNWLLTHSRHPYPNNEEKALLQRQTGLNRTQISNWLANARRRGKIQPARSTSPHVRNVSELVDVPQRRGTPALETMNPLQRWEHSPPEHEPASIPAIARAVGASASSVSSSGHNTTSSFNYASDSSNKSLCNQSSASSIGTSRSSNASLTSAFSHGTRGSWGSLGSATFGNGGRRRRRRRITTNKTASSPNLLATLPAKAFQCTFCTETFRTKYDWQRHEKSLHLSLERWICAPDAPRCINPENGLVCCVFCGEADPSDAHVGAHDHAACQERSLDERTFYRKDHLNQHLRLVHNVKFLDWAMKDWKIRTPEIKSRCGFCGIVMDTWTARVEHLAEHFKLGFSMADWKGDWGFEPPVLKIIENSIPPYLIHHERQSPNPYMVCRPPEASPRNAYELIKLELACFSADYQEQHGRVPSDEGLMLEGCRIIFSSELLSRQGIATQSSWLRDLIMSNEKVAQKARFGPLRGPAEHRLHILQINGKDNLFEACPIETQLHDFVKARRLLGLVPADDELQDEACRIVARVEEVCTLPSEAVANWLLRIIQASTGWLSGFRERAHLPQSEEQQSAVRFIDPTSVDQTIHHYSGLESELAEYLRQQRSLEREPSDKELQQKARMFIYEFDDGWNQTVADNTDWLKGFRDRVGPADHSKEREARVPCPPGSSLEEASSSQGCGNDSKVESMTGASRGWCIRERSKIDQVHDPASFLYDCNCYHRLAKELGRWVKSAISPNNPNQHIPSDEELRYQARWIIYENDDAWNQTAADNAEWLRQFKRDVGISNEEDASLPVIDASVSEQGAMGLAPFGASPEAHVERSGEQVEMPSVKMSARGLATSQSAASTSLDTTAWLGHCEPAAAASWWQVADGFMTQQHDSVPTIFADDAVLLEKNEASGGRSAMQETVTETGRSTGPQVASPRRMDGPNVPGEAVGEVPRHTGFEIAAEHFVAADGIQQDEGAGDGDWIWRLPI